MKMDNTLEKDVARLTELLQQLTDRELRIVHSFVEALTGDADTEEAQHERMG